MGRYLKRCAAILVISVLFVSEIPFGFIVDVSRDGNVVDVLYQAYQSGTLDEHFGPKKARAAGSYTEVRNFKCNARSTWTDLDLSGFGVPANSVVEIMASNNYNSDELQGGMRANGSSLARLMDLREAESGGATAGDAGTGASSLVMHVQTDANSIIECFSENPDVVTFKILGWWDCPGGGCYIERFDTLNAAGAAVWENENLSGFGVFHGDVVEVVAENSLASAAREVGIRADGSTLERRVVLGESESGGDTLVTMNAVAVGVSATIEIYEEVLTSTSFRLVGFWDDPPGVYTELFQTLSAPGSDNTWTDSDLTSFGVGANDIAEIVLANGSATTQNLMGVRANGSNILRATALAESEAGGRTTARMHVAADASSLIEMYHEDVSDTAYEFLLVGYWDAGDYTEEYSFSCNARNAWTDMDLSVLGVPAHAVAEIAIGNRYYNDEQVGGVRTNGSALTRSMDIAEAEGPNSAAADAGNGISYMVMHVQTDANSTIECFAENPDTIDFEVLGYWSCPGGGCYAERFDTLNAAGAAVWENENLSGFGVSNGDVVEVVAENSLASAARYMGIRTDGSSLDRFFDITEAEAGGDRLLTMNAVAVGASATIEIYEEVISSGSFRLLGYWDDPPGTYTELFTTLTAPVGDNAWNDIDLSSHGVGAGDIAEIIFANGLETSDNRFGARMNGSTINRTLSIVESEDNALLSTDTNRMLSRLHVPTDGSSLIEIVHQDVSDTVYEFQLVGFWSLPATFEQSAYRFFGNDNSTDVGSALAAQNTEATLAGTGDAFRLRMLVHIGSAQLPLSGQSFKLQFAEQSGTCDAAFSGESYADVTAGTVIAFNDNLTPTDGAALSANANDPTHSGHSIVNQTYEELNNFTNSQAVIPSGQDGKWDFSLIDNGADPDTSYCFRIVRSDGSELDTYSVIPEVLTATSAPVYSVSISPGGVIEYGFVELGNATSTVGGLYTQTVENDGTATEKLNVKSSNATGGATWTLATTTGANQFKHEFSTTTGATWVAMPDSDTYVTAVPSVSQAGSATFDFQLTTPTASADYQEKSITITVQAVAP